VGGPYPNTACNITFLSSARVLLPFQESRAVNKKNTHSLITSPLTQIELKSFAGIMGRYLLVLVDVSFYKTGSVPLSCRDRGLYKCRGEEFGGIVVA
jgi:hypothetical protein